MTLAATTGAVTPDLETFRALAAEVLQRLG